MMRIATFCLSLALLAGCQTTCCDPEHAPQTVVAAIATQNSDVTRLTLHCRTASENAAKVCASTDSARVGTASDPEDLKALTSGETVVLEEGGALDVTVPILMTDGSWTTVCGVTLATNGMGREQVVAKATAIAMAVKAGLGDRCCDGGSCCNQ